MVTMRDRTCWAIVLFWGAAWGLAEATVGFGLHLAPMPGQAGAVLFPVAAALKLLDLAIPGADPFAVANPAAAILLQSLAVGMMLRFRPVREGRLGAETGLAAALGWRAGYVLVIAGAAALLPLHGLADHGAAGLSRFLLLEGVVNALLIGLFMELDRRLSVRWPRLSAAPNPIAAGALAALAASAGLILL